MAAARWCSSPRSRGSGSGARYAGLAGTDAGPDAPYLSERTAPHARVHAAGHPTALWSVEGAPDRAVYVGEALGHWLWVVLWPDTAGLMVLDRFVLVDLRDAGHVLDVPLGAASPGWLPDRSPRARVLRRWREPGSPAGAATS